MSKGMAMRRHAIVRGIMGIVDTRGVGRTIEACLM
jgi:hypothetical protein